MNVKGKKKKNQVVAANIFEQQELIAKVEEIKNSLKALTWHELETKGKFDKNEKLTFISDDMLILGCDVGSETHYVRAVDTRGVSSVSPHSHSAIQRKDFKVQGTGLWE